MQDGKGKSSFVNTELENIHVFEGTQGRYAIWSQMKQVWSEAGLQRN